MRKKAVLLFGLALALSLAASPAGAGDWKNLPGSVCAPEGAAVWDDNGTLKPTFTRAGGALVNSSTQGAWVSCPILGDDSRDDLDKVQVAVTDNNNARRIFCSVVASINWGTTTATRELGTAETTRPFRGLSTLTIRTQKHPEHAAYSVRCWIWPTDRIREISWEE